jgi:nitrate reductase gamma subunit
VFNLFLFVAIPYAAVAVAVLGGIVRFHTDRFSITSNSSQFLESRALFWGSNAWHYAIILILGAHLAAFLAPGWWSSLLGAPVRLYILEVTGIALAVLACFGLLVLIGRRLLNTRITRVTSHADWLLLALLLGQTAFGLYIAIANRWGGDWYPHTVVPWLRSLVVLQPKVATMTGLPWPVQAHAVGGFLLVMIFPFTRLVHIVTYPLGYLWRPYQRVIWNRRRTPVPGR